MLELEQTIFWKISIEKIEELILKHFSISVDIVRDMELNNRDYIISNYKFESQKLDQSTIEFCLSDRETQYERLDRALWCLIMKDVLPEGNYLVSIFW